MRVEQRRRQLARRAVEHDLAGLERDGARAIAHRVFDLMQRDQDGDAVAPVHVGQDVHDAARGIRIERGDRLVGDEELGALHEGAGDGGALLLAAGKLASRA